MALARHNQRPQDINIEALLDRRVQRRLATDAAYRNAENAEEQQEREEQIEREECARLGIPCEL
jgi:hypothetical protein